jgi:hypothetical protein
VMRRPRLPRNGRGSPEFFGSEQHATPGRTPQFPKGVHDGGRGTSDRMTIVAGPSSRDTSTLRLWPAGKYAGFASLHPSATKCGTLPAIACAANFALAFDRAEAMNASISESNQAAKRAFLKVLPHRLPSAP